MKKGLKKIIMTAAGVAMLSTTFSTSYANEIDSELQNAISQSKVEKLNLEKLIVVEKDVYRKILSADTAIIENEENLLTIDSENISEDEHYIIESSDSFYLFGDFNGDISSLKDSENYEGDLFTKDKYKSSLEKANKNKDRDIIFVDGESMADYFIATQMGNVENKNILLIEDELTKETKEYLVDNGSGKTISFVEGDSSISEKTKEEIMKVSGGEKYELGQSQVIKEEAAKKDFSESISEKRRIKDSEGGNDTTSKLILASVETSRRNKEIRNEFLNDKQKVLKIEDLTIDEENEEGKEESEKEILDIVESIESIESDSKSINVLTDEEIEKDDKKGHSLKITEANPIDINSSVEEGKQEFIVPKETNDKVVKSVINGDYGDFDDYEKVSKELTKNGYNAEEVQRKAKKIENERIEKEKEAERKAEEKRKEEAAKKAKEEAAKKAEAERIAAEKRAVERRADEKASQVARTQSQSSSSGFIRPASGYVSSNYGYRTHPVTGERKLHKGMDIAGGGSIVAAQSGTVTVAGYSDGYGYHVKINHDNGYETLYAHMTPGLNVSVGSKVSQGQRLGTMGTTGMSTGVHLHFEVHKNGSTVDPASYVGS